MSSEELSGFFVFFPHESKNGYSEEMGQKEKSERNKERERLHNLLKGALLLESRRLYVAERLSWLTAREEMEASAPQPYGNEIHHQPE